MRVCVGMDFTTADSKTTSFQVTILEDSQRPPPTPNATPSMAISWIGQCGSGQIKEESATPCTVCTVAVEQSHVKAEWLKQIHSC